MTYLENQLELLKGLEKRMETLKALDMDKATEVDFIAIGLQVEGLNQYMEALRERIMRMASVRSVSKHFQIAMNQSDFEGDADDE